MVNQSLAKGGFLCAIALFFGAQAYGYAAGSFTRPGPALFPLMVSAALLVLGAAIVARGFLTTAQFLDFRIRNIALVASSIVAFALVSTFVNMLAGVGVMTFMASYASDDFSVARSLKIFGALSLIALAMVKGLGFQLPLF